MADRIERSLTILMAAATLVSAGVLVKRASSDSPVTQPTRHSAPRYIEEWRRAMPLGIRLGERDAAIQIVEFTDFECPFCRRFHERVLPNVFNAFPDSVELVIVHYPLPMHRFAKIAARAVECSAREERGPQGLIDVLYAKQDSFGLKPWGMFGLEAGLVDTAAFAKCIFGDEAFDRIEAGSKLASDFGVTGTPGVLLNGWLFEVPPTDTSLIATARILLARGNRLPTMVPPRR